MHDRRRLAAVLCMVYHICTGREQNILYALACASMLHGASLCNECSTEILLCLAARL